MIIIGARPPISVGFEKKVEIVTYAQPQFQSYKVEIIQATLQWTQIGNDFKLV